jgi:membrane-associated phospholipid phosphatase
MRPWVLPSPTAIPVPPPPADAGHVRRAATAADRALVRRWSDGGATAPWTSLNLDLVSQTTLTPPRVSRGYALVSVAMYDAVVAARAWQKRYGSSSYPSAEAAIAGAASRVLAYLFPQRPRASFDRLAAEAARSRVLAGKSYPADVAAGLDLGRGVAQAVIARARRDGSDRTWHGRIPSGRDHWAPTRPGADPADPLARTWRTWVLRSPSEFRPPRPPVFGSRRFVAEAREVLELRTRLTPEQMRIARFWEGGPGTPLPPGVWNEVALAYVKRDRLGPLESARVFALLNVAMADTGVATWDAKYAYWTPRPETAIRRLGLGHGWKPFLVTPSFPAYVSAHSAYSGAASVVLARLFPRDAAAFRLKARQAGISRLYGGIHYRSDHTEGIKLGRRVGSLVLRRAGL